MAYVRKDYVPPVKGVRRAEYSDLEAIGKLVSQTSIEYFGNDINVPLIVERSFLSLLVTNTADKIVACMCFMTGPNVPAIPPWDWLPWMKNLYKTERLTSRNSLFIHLMVWDPRYKSEFISYILAATFYQFLYIHHIMLVAPPGVPTLFFVEEHFTRLLPDGYTDSKRVQTIYITLRQHHVSRYKIRRAVEEDNDDLVPLLNEHTTRLKEIYGDYYISEIIQRHPDCNRQFIVAESNETAIGVLCLTTNIDYELLNQCFECTPYHGFRKPAENDMLPRDQLKRDSVEDTQEDFQLTNSMDLLETVAVEQEIGPTPPRSISSSSSDDFDIVDSVPSFHFFDLLNLADQGSTVHSRTSLYSVIVLNREDVDDASGSHNQKDYDYEHSRTKRARLLNQIKQMAEGRVPTYFGAPNAFAIELMTSVSANERAVAADLIEAAFECYPDRDYCIMSVPTTYPPWPLLQPFVRCAPRPYTTFTHEVYFLHRNSMLSDLEVRMATASDIIAVQNLLHGISKEKEILEDFISSVSLFESPHRSYLMLTEDCVVGCMIVREEDEYDYLSSHYEVNRYIDLQHYPIGSFGLLVHAIVSPIFQTHKRYFLREVHRLSDLPAIHHCLYPADATDRSLANIVAEMIAVAPRLRPEYHPNKDTDGDVPMDFVLRQDPPYALYVINPRHCSNPKMDVNRRMVVVGASTTGLSFIEHFVFGATASYISFTNVTMVSPHGLSHMKAPQKARDLLFPFDGRYNYRHMRQISVHCYVNLVTGVMTAINRKDKYITINEDYIIPYDYLFLTCGEQYQIPQASTCEKHDYFPENVFIVNTEIDGSNALASLKEIITPKTKTYTIIVYGATLEAYCCLSALQEFGVPGPNITFVEPFPDPAEPNGVSLFNDGEVDDAIALVLKHEGIVVHTSYYFCEWEWGHKEKRIKSVKFESKFRMLHIPCIAMFFYDRKTVSTKTLSAINHAGLVYDSRLVIDPLYKTNDPCIFSAGSMTKYSRRYHADHMSHKYFNHIEIGAELATYAHHMLDPTFVMEAESPSVIYMRKVLTPLYSQPIVKYCTLPNGLNYLYITKPGKPIPIEAQMNKEDYGKIYITGDAKTSGQGYFRLHLNPNRFVETITCLTRGEIDVQNMIKLWGKHERLLNNLVQRFETMVINDLFVYFREPWVYAIFHESYQYKVENPNYNMLTGAFPGCDSALINKIHQLFEANDWTQLTAPQRNELVQMYTTSIQQKEIMRNLLNFLLEYDMHLPVYAHPLKVKLILAGFENSPLHLQQ